ncbi:hypothetical protein, partial [Streptococcus pseudopneumoniae]|uniref:hypothetical protein n=1 Tax=Streptococcus pseudopneumoniae TaxID=257758 RepID=UPI001BB2A398
MKMREVLLLFLLSVFQLATISGAASFVAHEVWTKLESSKWPRSQKLPLKVVDNSGQGVGDIIGLVPKGGNSHPVVLFESNGELLPINVGRHGFRLEFGVFFATNDCTGQAFILIGEPGVAMLAPL